MCPAGIVTDSLTPESHMHTYQPPSQCSTEITQECGFENRAGIDKVRQSTKIFWHIFSRLTTQKGIHDWWSEFSFTEHFTQIWTWDSSLFPLSPSFTWVKYYLTAQEDILFFPKTLVMASCLGATHTPWASWKSFMYPDRSTCCFHFCLSL